MDVHPTKNGIFIGIDPYPNNDFQFGEWSLAFKQNAKGHQLDYPRGPTDTSARSSGNVVGCDDLDTPGVNALALKFDINHENKYNVRPLL